MIISNLKTAKANQLTSAVISSTSTKKQTIEKMIKGVRQEISHKSWTKIILSTNSHLTYNLYIEVLCTYFPKKAVTQPPKAPHSESDDDSEQEYFIPQQRNATYVNCELSTIPTRATTKQTKVLTGATIGSVCLDLDLDE